MPKLNTAVVVGGVIACLTIATPAHASFDDQYVCDAIGDGNYVIVVSSRDGNNASAQYNLSPEYASEGGSDTTPMRRIASDGSLKYAGLGLVFEAGEDGAMLETGSGLVECQFAGEGAEEPEEEDALEIPARSWGGKLRAGPGMEFDQVGSLREGDPVTLLVNTGVEMGGYSWFLVRLPDGGSAYQWGGLLCSDALHVIGIFGDRDCPVR